VVLTTHPGANTIERTVDHYYVGCRPIDSLVSGENTGALRIMNRYAARLETGALLLEPTPAALSGSMLLAPAMKSSSYDGY